MKNSSRPAKTLERETEVYRAFLGLDHRHRRRLAVRILRNQRVLNDLYDHLLIEQSLREPGRGTAWNTYVKRKKPAGR